MGLRGLVLPRSAKHNPHSEGSVVLLKPTMSINLSVGLRGLEPPHLTAQPPQDCVYTNFTTSPNNTILRSFTT